MLLGSTTIQAATVAIDTSNGYFPKQAVTGVVKATQKSCDLIDRSGMGRAVWVQVRLNGYDYQECIRYYQYGLTATRSANKLAIVYFSGDVWTSSGVTSSYLKQRPQDKQNEAVSWSMKLGNKPYIFVARPGIYGSSGVHKGARKPLESLLMTVALDKIKQRHNIQNFVLTGQSSGGHVVAALISRRQDVICAVPASGPASPQLRATLTKASAPVRELEAVDQLTSYNMRHPKLRVIVLGDLKDKNVPWGAQKVLHDKLVKLKWTSTTINLSAKDSTHHVLADQGRLIADMCADGRSDSYIKNAIKGAQFK